MEIKNRHRLLLALLLTGAFMPSPLPPSTSAFALPDHNITAPAHEVSPIQNSILGYGMTTTSTLNSSAQTRNMHTTTIVTMLTNHSTHNPAQSASPLLFFLTIASYCELSSLSLPSCCLKQLILKLWPQERSQFDGLRIRVQCSIQH